MENNKLVAVRVEGEEDLTAGEEVWLRRARPAAEMRLEEPVDFYIAERARNPLPLKPGQELWIESDRRQGAAATASTRAEARWRGWKPLQFPERTP